MSDDVIIAPAIATTALVPEAHVRMGPTAHEPVARVKLNAWGVVTDAVKAAASALPVVQLVKPAAAQPAKPAAPAKRIEIVEPTKPAAPAPAPKAQAAAPVITPKPAQPTKRAKRAERAKQAKLSGLVEPVYTSPMAFALKRAFQQREQERMQAEAA